MQPWTPQRIKNWLVPSMQLLTIVNVPPRLPAVPLQHRHPVDDAVNSSCHVVRRAKAGAVSRKQRRRAGEGAQEPRMCTRMQDGQKHALIYPRTGVESEDYFFLPPLSI